MQEKRKKWKSSEDEILKTIIQGKCLKTINWEEISEEIQKFNINKSAKQCRERWTH